jgi:hypothetical protein
MRGIAEFNFPAFDRAADVLRGAGYDCFNPADNDRLVGFDGAGWTGFESLAERSFDLRDAMATDLEFIARMADAVCVLPGWQDSKGACAEVAVAHALGLPVAPVEAFLPAGIAPELLVAPAPELRTGVQAS